MAKQNKKLLNNVTVRNKTNEIKHNSSQINAPEALIASKEDSS